MLRAFSKHQQNMDDAKIVPGSAIPVALDDVIRSMTCLWSKAWKRDLYYYCTCSSGILLKVIAKRLQAKAEADKCLGEDQFGFRKGRGTRDAIGALRMLTERSLEHKQEVYI